MLDRETTPSCSRLGGRRLLKDVNVTRQHRILNKSKMYLSINSSTKRPGIFNLSFIEDTDYLKDLEWYCLGRGSGGLKRG